MRTAKTLTCFVLFFAEDKIARVHVFIMMPLEGRITFLILYGTMERREVGWDIIGNSVECVFVYSDVTILKGTKCSDTVRKIMKIS